MPAASGRWKVTAACAAITSAMGKRGLEGKQEESWVLASLPRSLSRRDNCLPVTAEVRHDGYVGKSSQLRDLPAATQFNTGVESQFSRSPPAQALSGWIRVQAVILRASLPSNRMQPHQRARRTGCYPGEGWEVARYQA